MRHIFDKDLLVRKSGYFCAMLSGPWKDSSLDTPHELALVEPKVFPGNVLRGYLISGLKV